MVHTQKPEAELLSPLENMTNKIRAEPSEFCKVGQLIERTQSIAFPRWTDKGYLLCRGSVLIAVCEKCGSRNWDDLAETTIAEAVRKAYQQLR
jgi:hypothetical protein